MRKHVGECSLDKMLLLAQTNSNLCTRLPTAATSCVPSGLKQMSLTTLLMPSRSGTRSDQVVTLRMVAARPGAPRRRAPCGRGLSDRYSPAIEIGCSGRRSSRKVAIEIGLGRSILGPSGAGETTLPYPLFARDDGAQR